MHTFYIMKIPEIAEQFIGGHYLFVVILSMIIIANRLVVNGVNHTIPYHTVWHLSNVRMLNIYTGRDMRQWIYLQWVYYSNQCFSFSPQPGSVSLPLTFSLSLSLSHPHSFPFIQQHWWTTEPTYSASNRMHAVCIWFPTNLLVSIVGWRLTWFQTVTGNYQYFTHVASPKSINLLFKKVIGLSSILWFVIDNQFKFNPSEERTTTTTITINSSAKIIPKWDNRSKSTIHISVSICIVSFKSVIVSLIILIRQLLLCWSCFSHGVYMVKHAIWHVSFDLSMSTKPKA